MLLQAHVPCNAGTGRSWGTRDPCPPQPCGVVLLWGEGDDFLCTVLVHDVGVDGADVGGLLWVLEVLVHFVLLDLLATSII